MKIALIAIAFLMSTVFSQAVVNGPKEPNRFNFFASEPVGFADTNPQGRPRNDTFGILIGSERLQDGLFRNDGTDPFLGGEF